MNDRQNISVAVPWSLSHYIPLNGFHPLYRALFDHAPDNISLHAWDNVKLHRRFESNAATRQMLMKKANSTQKKYVENKYEKYFSPLNQVLTAELMGNIEFHHTVPVPSLQRPFILHCEIFAPLLQPFAHHGMGQLKRSSEIRDYYGAILGHPLCLGVWSHMPATIETIRKFFSNPIIDQKLFQSKIGISANSLMDQTLPDKTSLSRPRFLFMNSAHQIPSSFFLSGGHIVLRFWKEYLASGREGVLTLRCTRPRDEDLLYHGVDMAMVCAEVGRSIVWVQDYWLNHEVNALMASSHFFLLPSASLHSASIMQAMLLGTIPIVTDTVGTSVYVTNCETGIIVDGMRDAVWREDEETGILIDRYSRIPELDDSLVSQISGRIGMLVDDSAAYNKMRDRMLAHAKKEFSGEAFSNQFWGAVSDIYRQNVRISDRPDTVSDKSKSALSDCMIQGTHDEWARVFESPTFPMLRVNTGQGMVFECGGAMLHACGNPEFKLNDWSVLAQDVKSGALQTTFAYTLEELEGKYLPFSVSSDKRVGSILSWRFIEVASRALIGWVARILKPFPRIYRVARWVLSRFRHLKQWVISP